MVTGGLALEQARQVRQVRQVRELERQVAILRNALAAVPPTASAAQRQEWKDEVVRLLSEVVMFRLALDQETVLSSFKSK